MIDTESQIIRFLMTTDATRRSPDWPLDPLESDRQRESSRKLYTATSSTYFDSEQSGINSDIAQVLIAEEAAEPWRLEDVSGPITAFRLSGRFGRLRLSGRPGRGG